MKEHKNRGVWRIVIIAMVFCSTLNACTPATKFWPTTDYQSEKITSQNVITFKKIDFQGDLKDVKANSSPEFLGGGTKTDLFSSFLTGFKKKNQLVDLVRADNKELNYSDMELLLTLTSKSSLPLYESYRAVPLVNYFRQVGTVGMASSNIDFDWDVTVKYEFINPAGQLVDNSSFDLKGKHQWKATIGSGVAETVVGIGPAILLYPGIEASIEISDKLLNAVGEEMAKRLSSTPVKTYLANREKQRDGMDIKTYVEFLEKKKRLEKEREIAKVERLKDLDVKLKYSDQVADIKSGTVMVLGIGVSKYQSKQIPTLKYADRDSQRIVKHFKDRYKLSDDRAMLLTNEDATAIKISRFITQNAAKLLTKDDTFILYFGGHGAPDVDGTSNDNDGLKKYLLLHDSELDSLPMTALSLNNLAILLEKLPCKRVVILLDSCFAGTAGVQTLAKLKGLRVSEKSYKNITEMSGEGRVILAASSENQVSHEEDSLQAGVFTHYLLEGLNGKADLKGEGKINILGLYEYVTKEVSKYTQNRQSPVFRGTLDMNIVF